MNQPIVLSNYSTALQPAVTLFKDNPLITKVHIFDPLKEAVKFGGNVTYDDPISPVLYIRCNITADEYKELEDKLHEISHSLLMFDSILLPYRDERDEEIERYQADITLYYEGGDANEE